MSITETVCYLNGQDRRHRQQWEQTRLLAGLVCKVLTGDDIGLEFPWDDEAQEDKPETTPEELEALRAAAREAERTVNGTGNL